jgi:TatA/E family protein of Tat protein translocase
MFGIGVGEIAIIGLITLLFVGPKKLPELARGLGEGIGSFKRAIRDQNLTLGESDE